MNKGTRFSKGPTIQLVIIPYPNKNYKLFSIIFLDNKKKDEVTEDPKLSEQSEPENITETDQQVYAYYFQALPVSWFPDIQTTDIHI